jgi:hypothetical protein
MRQTYFVYLDEFGHVGPFISRQDSQHNTSPVFGFGGIALPSSRVREFSTWFYQLKCKLLAFEIARDGIAAHRWEKKGSSLYTTTNVLRYRELRSATNWLLNRIQASGGFVIYVGIEKTAPMQVHQPNAMTLSILRETTKRLDQHCTEYDSGFILFLDDREDKSLREAVVTVTQQEMYGPNPRYTLIEAPTQVESHRYQMVQAADWICGLLGRIEAFRTRRSEYPDYAWTEKYFVDRVNRVALRSGVRRQPEFASETIPGGFGVEPTSQGLSYSLGCLGR